MRSEARDQHQHQQPSCCVGEESARGILAHSLTRTRMQASKQVDTHTSAGLTCRGVEGRQTQILSCELGCSVRRSSCSCCCLHGCCCCGC